MCVFRGIKHCEKLSVQVKWRNNKIIIIKKQVIDGHRDTFVVYVCLIENLKQCINGHQQV